MRSRIITALILIPLVVLGVLKLDTAYLAALLGVFLVAGADELARISGLRGGITRVLYLLFFTALLVLLYPVRDALPGPFLGLIAAWWLGQTLLLVFRRDPLIPVPGLKPVTLATGSALLLVAWIALLQLHERPEGPLLVLFVMVMIWVVDSGAYFAGRAFGRHKLSPRVSPGKTWEGVGGALLGAGLCAVGLVLSGILATGSWPGVLLVCVLTALISIGGDLWESSIKRRADMKDSGALLPGHGGVLDRIDSLVAAVPTFVFGVMLLDRFA